MEVDVAFAGVAEAGSGREIDGETVVVAPIGEAGAVAEDDAGGDFIEARVSVDIGLREVGGQGDVEGKFALVDEFQDSVGEDRFAEGGGFEDGVGGYGVVRFGVFYSEGEE